MCVSRHRSMPELRLGQGELYLLHHSLSIQRRFCVLEEMVKAAESESTLGERACIAWAPGFWGVFAGEQHIPRQSTLISDR